MQKLDMLTPDIIQANIEALAKLFPNIITETENADGTITKAIDYDLFRQMFSSTLVEGGEERYRLDWPGKRASILKANTPISKTLRPVVADSVNWDTTENLYIEGDNFEVLKVLQESYLGKVKMIYIDPPYNTGKDFVYTDNFKVSKDEYEEGLEIVDEEGGRLVKNTDTNGRFHSDWLSMMYERLVVARDLLSDNGAIVIHMDENEYTNLDKILSEIFGEENNLGTIIWDKRNPKGEVVGIAQQHESILFYCKNKESFKNGNDFKRKKENAEKIIKKAKQLISKHGGISDLVRFEFKDWISMQNFSEGEKAYNLISDSGRVFQSVSMAAPDKPETRSHRPLVHPITKLPCPTPEKGWRFTDSSMDALLKQNQIYFGNDNTVQPRRMYFLEENLFENVSSLLYFGGSDDALGLPFDNPKPVNVVNKMIDSLCQKGDIILDFFSGSATTAHAVIQLNAEDEGNRKFIMVQIPEETDKESEAYKAGYSNICEIGKERIRRAGKKIVEENKDKEGIENLDIGFRVYRLDTSNMKDVYYHPTEVTQDRLFEMESNIREDRTGDDLLTQVMLDLGLTLDLPIEKRVSHGATIYSVACDSLIACFDDHVDFALVDEIASLRPLRVVFRDSSFQSDADRINFETRFSKLSPETDIRVI